MTGIDHARAPWNVEPYRVREAVPPDDNMEALVQRWDWYRSRVAVFLGAGASVGAVNRAGDCLPSAVGLRDELWRRFMLPPGSDPDRFDTGALALMGLEHAAALVEANVGRAALREYIVERFTCAAPLWQHAVLPLIQPHAVFTTNYDELAEKGFRVHPPGRPTADCEVTYSGAPPLAGKTPVFKPHGTITQAAEPLGRGGLVITTFDYFEVIDAYRNMLKAFLQRLESRCVIFVGYSFSDMDIGSEIYAMRRKSRDVPWYAVFPRGDANVRRMYAEKLGVRQINRTFFEFMAELDDRVGFIPADWKRDRIDDLRGRDLIQ